MHHVTDNEWITWFFVDVISTLGFCQRFDMIWRHIVTLPQDTGLLPKQLDDENGGILSDACGKRSLKRRWWLSWLGYHNNDHVGTSGGRDPAGKRPQAAVDDQRGVVRGRAGVETVPGSRDIPRRREQVLRGRRDRNERSSVLLVSHARVQTTWILHHQHLRRHGNCILLVII